MLKPFKFYFSERQQSIRLRDVISAARDLAFGVPQGSVLGPHLFSLCTLTLRKVIIIHEASH